MRAFIFVTLIAGGVMLAACAADSRSALPEFMRAQAAEPPPLSQPLTSSVSSAKNPSLSS